MLAPGDVLFVPAFYLHTALALNAAASVALCSPSDAERAAVALETLPRPSTARRSRATARLAQADARARARALRAARRARARRSTRRRPARAPCECRRAPDAGDRAPPARGVVIERLAPAFLGVDAWRALVGGVAAASDGADAADAADAAAAAPPLRAPLAAADAHNGARAAFFRAVCGDREAAAADALADDAAAAELERGGGVPPTARTRPTRRRRRRASARTAPARPKTRGARRRARARSCSRARRRSRIPSCSTARRATKLLAAASGVRGVLVQNLVEEAAAFVVGTEVDALLSLPDGRPAKERRFGRAQVSAKARYEYSAKSP